MWVKGNSDNVTKYDIEASLRLNVRGVLKNFEIFSFGPCKAEKKKSHQLEYWGHFKPNFLCHFWWSGQKPSAHWKANAETILKHPLHWNITRKWGCYDTLKQTKTVDWASYWKKGGFSHDFKVQVKIFKPDYLSFPWSKLENLSAHQVQKFLNFSNHHWLLFLVVFLGELLNI